MTHETDSRAKRLEQAAIAAYRAKFPKAPPWQELSDKTRLMWVFYVENMAQPAAHRRLATKECAP